MAVVAWLVLGCTAFHARGAALDHFERTGAEIPDLQGPRGALGQTDPRWARSAVFTVLEENDLVVKTDRHYTQGIKLSFVHADNSIPDWLRWISDKMPAVAFSKFSDRFGYDIGQNIYTPRDLQATELQVDDRPYAGWLYAGLILQRRGLTARQWLTLESLQLDVGVIGPESLAKESQTWVHEVRNFDLPQGWDNQLDTEPSIEIKYYRGLRLSPEGPQPRYIDFIPRAGASLGNAETSFRAGATARLGLNLPDDFGVQNIHSLLTTEGGLPPDESRSWGFYAFAGLEGSYVAYSAFLDGNLWHSSHHVDREPLTAEARAGVVVGLKHAELALSYVYRTREFEGQERDNGYGSLAVKVRF